MSMLENEGAVPEPFERRYWPDVPLLKDCRAPVVVVPDKTIAFVLLNDVAPVPPPETSTVPAAAPIEISSVT
jgi:hypothetical protein